jgi:hypothetical protein
MAKKERLITSTPTLGKTMPLRSFMICKTQLTHNMLAAGLFSEDYYPS